MIQQIIDSDVAAGTWWLDAVLVLIAIVILIVLVAVRLSRRLSLDLRDVWSLLALNARRRWTRCCHPRIGQSDLLGRLLNLVVLGRLVEVLWWQSGGNIHRIALRVDILKILPAGHFLTRRHLLQ